MNLRLSINNSLHQPCVAQIIGTFGGGGAQRLAYNLAQGLAGQGIRSLAIALREKGSYAENTGTEVKLFALGTDVGKLSSIFNTYFALRRLIREERIEVLHVHGAPSLPFVVVATRFLPQKPKLVFTWHDSGSVLEKISLRERLMIWSLSRCDLVTGSSRLVTKKLADRASLSCVNVFHGGVPLSPPSSQIDSPCPMILWVGRIVPPKDPQILVRAASLLKSEGLKFSVCMLGKPIPSTVWYMDETRALIEQLGLGDVISTPGFALDDELQKIMEQADISVQTSHTEGLSLALLEQMMAGLAIIATDVGDTTVAIQDGINGIVIPPKDEARLVTALRQLLTDPSLRRKYASAARERAVNCFSVRAMATNAKNDYVKLLAENKLAPR